MLIYIIFKTQETLEILIIINIILYTYVTTNHYHEILSACHYRKI